VNTCEIKRIIIEGGGAKRKLSKGNDEYISSFDVRVEITNSFGLSYSNSITTNLEMPMISFTYENYCDRAIINAYVHNVMGGSCKWYSNSIEMDDRRIVESSITSN